MTCGGNGYRENGWRVWSLCCPLVDIDHLLGLAHREAELDRVEGVRDPHAEGARGMAHSRSATRSVGSDGPGEEVSPPLHLHARMATEES
jgi:hypothetical protein